ncbi:AAA domain-containing protein [Amycolatopsis sp. YIM 10]|uniref:AAA domain-containing protein n=1 Tax=Amycolatopsis sp. YIM 10 TaxID=2653857 RepID=UPI0012A85959|nr:AAA domain-containing protein [Amycolatopsis sp. YIM 10]QFU88954.1 RecBCD enzyme subunit RecD [Amycolatopsis sp. YIM 10]
MGTSLVDRARRLFEFLRGAQRLKASPVRSVEGYQRDGAVFWFAQLPRHPGVRAAQAGLAGIDDPLVVVDRVPKVEPPEPDAELARWLTEQWDQPDQPPTLRQRVRFTGEDEEGESRVVTLAEAPEVEKQFRLWLPAWEKWASQELVDAPVRQLYSDLYSTYISATESPEELELVLGVGCLSWLLEDQQSVLRHVLTSSATLHFDDRTGAIEARRVEAGEPLRLELDMVDPGLITAPDKVNEVRADVEAFDGSPLDRGAVGELVRRLVHSLDPDGEYRDQDEFARPAPHAVASLAPALILRRRTENGLIEIFDAILRQLGDAGEVPDGLVPLVDPDRRPVAPGPTGEGAIVAVGDEPFLPMPVNDKQLTIIRKVDAQAQTLVQGPPGTGKTHTAAALISHLLAQGKRVLVTAHTDRALREVREKLPDAIKPLSVAVVGAAREDMADLKLAVQEIAAAAVDHDSKVNADAVRSHLDAIDLLRRERAASYSRLVEAREREVRHREHRGYRGTLAAIARQLDAESDAHRWLSGHTTVGADDPVPLSGRETVEWHGHLLDERLRADEAEALMRLLGIEAVPAPDEFALLVRSERGSTAEEQRHAPLKGHAAFAAVMKLSPDERTRLRQRLHRLADEADRLAGRREQWMNDALQDVRSGRAGQWRVRADTVQALAEQCAGCTARLGPLTSVELRGEPGPLVALAGEVLRFLADGGSIKTLPDGQPKIGAFSPKVLKQAQPLFDGVRVDGLPPTSAGQLNLFLAWIGAAKALSALDRAWPASVAIPAEDTLQERLQWHVTELDQLRHVLALGDELGAEEERLRMLNLPAPDWNDLNDVRRYARLTDAAGAEEAKRSATAPLAALEQLVAETAQWSDAAPCTENLLDAVKRRDHDAYASAHSRLERLWQVKRLVQRREELAGRLDAVAPELRRAIDETRHEEFWPSRIAQFDEAWRWAATRAWVIDHESIDVNSVQLRIREIEEHIRGHAESIAARRAWDFAASPERLSGTARADLTQYAQLVQRAGKNTGIYRNQRRGEIRKAMDRCRPSVPVWIMPIYRIAEQLRVRPDMFDVVVVDEASQAGTEAVFLQYLAPKIVVIGDDKQVSPSAVGVDQQQLRDLARQYLGDDRYRDSWHDPRRSLFDEAKMRYGNLITLTEHRRCVPEIIGFSNRVAYAPDGIRLVPVRQYGADRLEPVKAVHLPEGYERGTTNKLNPVEAEAIVDQIEKCIADPAYDGKTFGVISLLGPAQAKDIQTRLLSRIPKGEWRARDLRCGDAADFQGSERDVVFLSMVAALAPGKRLVALTQEQYVQRYNVAVSRAKDQVWVFHSVHLDELVNQECMRFQLLDYSYGVMQRGQDTGDGPVGTVVPEDQRVDPFDSLFEQRVYNRIVDRGYTVEPQHEALGYRIDLVVVGGRGRLAVECDGDQWHGPDAYERDLARQRDLERCGWRFFRIPGSAFDVDPAAALSGLWEMLQEEGIHPSGYRDPATETAEPEAVEPRLHVVDEHVPALPDAQAEDEAELRWPVEEQLPEPYENIAGGGTLESYVSYTGTLVPVVEASRRELIDGIKKIVAIEGPMLGERIHSAYVHCSGGRRVGHQLARTLNSAVTAAVRQGVLEVDNPLSQSGVRSVTYRLPGQPLVRSRQLGPRDLDDVPPRELATLIAEAAGRHGWADEEALFRTVLESLGLKRLTRNVHDRLSSLVELARTHVPDIS